MLTHLVVRRQKRSLEGLKNYDPAATDRAPPHGRELEDFAAAGIEKPEDFKARCVDSFFFGSESDDRTIATAFNDKANPLGVKINHATLPTLDTGMCGT